MAKDNSKTLTVYITIAIAVISVIIGFYQASADIMEKCVSKEQYRCDREDDSKRLSRIEDGIEWIKNRMIIGTGR